MRLLTLAKKSTIITLLLLVNVFMGFFTQSTKSNYSFLEKILETLTWQNILIAIVVGTLATWLYEAIDNNHSQKKTGTQE